MAKDKRIAALKYVLFESPEIGDLFKRIVAVLLDESENLTCPVELTIEANEQGYSDTDIGWLYGDCGIATSSGRNVHFHEIFAITGSDLRFNYSRDDTSCRIGFWSKRTHKYTKFLSVKRSELKGIDLSRPGLYPRSEDRVLKRAS